MRLLWPPTNPLKLALCCFLFFLPLWFISMTSYQDGWAFAPAFAPLIFAVAGYIHGRSSTATSFYYAFRTSMYFYALIVLLDILLVLQDSIRNAFPSNEDLFLLVPLFLAVVYAGIWIIADTIILWIFMKLGARMTNQKKSLSQ